MHASLLLVIVVIVISCYVNLKIIILNIAVVLLYYVCQLIYVAVYMQCIINSYDSYVHYNITV